MVERTDRQTHKATTVPSLHMRTEACKYNAVCIIFTCVLVNTYSIRILNAAQDFPCWSMCSFGKTVSRGGSRIFRREGLRMQRIY